MEKLNYQDSVEQWGLWEIEIPGPSTGNPFKEQTVKAVITGKNETKEIDGFYDGNGKYKVRFMPSFQLFCPGNMPWLVTVQYPHSYAVQR